MTTVLTKQKQQFIEDSMEKPVVNSGGCGDFPVNNMLCMEELYCYELSPVISLIKFEKTAKCEIKVKARRLFEEGRTKRPVPLIGLKLFNSPRVTGVEELALVTAPRIPKGARNPAHK